MIGLAQLGGGTGLEKEGLGERLIGQSWCQNPEARVTSGALSLQGGPSMCRDPQTGRDPHGDTNQLLSELLCGSRVVSDKCRKTSADLPTLVSDSLQGTVSVIR